MYYFNYYLISPVKNNLNRCVNEPFKSPGIPFINKIYFRLYRFQKSACLYL